MLCYICVQLVIHSHPFSKQKKRRSCMQRSLTFLHTMSLVQVKITQLLYLLVCFNFFISNKRKKKHLDTLGFPWVIFLPRLLFVFSPHSYTTTCCKKYIYVCVCSFFLLTQPLSPYCFLLFPFLLLLLLLLLLKATAAVIIALVHSQSSRS
jgi:hypothetical protein